MKVVFARFDAVVLSFGTCTELLKLVLHNREIPRSIVELCCKPTSEVTFWLHTINCSSNTFITTIYVVELYLRRRGSGSRALTCELSCPLLLYGCIYSGVLMSHGRFMFKAHTQKHTHID